MGADHILSRWQHPGGAVLKSALAGVFLLVLGVMAYLVHSGQVARERGDDATPTSSDSRSTRGEPAPASAKSAATDTDQHPQTDQETLTPPARDTISPNPPNGMTFGGSGHFQLYRQGDITWRLNTSTGETCIVFATTEEWKQPRVRRAACPKANRLER